MAREALLRFAVGPDDIVVPDLSGQLPGRGMWTAARRDIVAQACAGNAFRRAARRSVTPLVGPHGEALDELVDAQLAQRCLAALGLARRAGCVIMGFEQVRAALKDLASDSAPTRRAAVLLTAEDAAADGREKLAAIAERAIESGVKLTQLTLFDAKTLGGALGREQIVHALIETAGGGEHLHAAARRLAMYRGAIPLTGCEGDRWTPSNTVDMD